MNINTPQDLKFKFKTQQYDKIIKLFDIDEGEVPLVHLLLALLGITNNRKIDLSSSVKENDRTREVSLRTMYPKNSNDYDSFFGLIMILDNTDKNYDTVINDLAFEKTFTNQTPFLKLKNVKTFFEYMLGGLEIFDTKILSSTDDINSLVSEIYDLIDDDSKKEIKILHDYLTEIKIW